MPHKKLFKFIALSTTNSHADLLPEWCDQVINAFILGGVGFFATMGGVLATGAETTWQAAMPASMISAGLQFLLSLAGQRGLKPSGDKK